VPGPAVQGAPGASAPGTGQRLAEIAGQRVEVLPSAGNSKSPISDDISGRSDSLHRDSDSEIAVLSLAEPDRAISRVARAVAAGATEVAPVAEGHGWRIGRVADPSGHHWEIGKRLAS
jgi:PhnB protein